MDFPPIFQLRPFVKALSHAAIDFLSLPLIQRHRYLISGGVTAMAYGLVFLALTGTPRTELKGQASNSFEGADMFSSREFSSFVVALNDTPDPTLATLDPESSADSLAASEERNEQAIVEDNSLSNTTGELRKPNDQTANPTPSRLQKDLSEYVATAANGMPTGTGTILDQIARCLPDGVRPRLTKAKMSLQFNSEGSLKSVPRMQIDLKTATNSEISEANLVVQAALQCGPYVAPGLEMASLEIIPDFGK